MASKTLTKLRLKPMKANKPTNPKTGDAAKEIDMLAYPEVVDFVAHLRLKNLARRTIEEYVKVLRSLFRYVGPGGASPTTITLPQLRSYLADLQDRGRAPKTISNYVLVIKRFFGFLEAEGYIAEDPSLRLPRPKVGQRLPRALSISQVQALFNSMDDSTPVKRRDKVFFQLLYACGLRISEATGLRVRDVDFDRGMLRVIGKGDKERALPLKPQVVDVLCSYVADHSLDHWLFPGRGDGPITFRNMEDRFKAYVRAAGLPEQTSPHALRHSIAVHYLLGSAPITFVQQLLGHSSLATTGIYTQLANDQMRQIAINTPTALDKVPAVEERTLKERMAVYEVEYEEWDALVAELVR